MEQDHERALPLDDAAQANPIGLNHFKVSVSESHVKPPRTLYSAPANPSNGSDCLSPNLAMQEITRVVESALKVLPAHARLVKDESR
jgi:hypothetical protein